MLEQSMRFGAEDIKARYVLQKEVKPRDNFEVGLSVFVITASMAAPLCVCVRECVCACACACVRVCVCPCVCMYARTVMRM